MNALVGLSALVAAASAQLALPYYGQYAGYTGFQPSFYSGYAAPQPYYGNYGYAGYAAPYNNYATTYHAQDELGQASYGHVQADQAHSAVRDAFGNVAGSYSYASPEGPITVRYTAGVNGFQVESNALPVAPVDTGVAPVYTAQAPQPVDFTPEVKAATAEHLAAVAEAKSRSRRSLAPAFYAGHAAFSPAFYAGHAAYSPTVYAGHAAYAPTVYAGAFSPATAYSTAGGYPAELTEVILNPGHATAYRVDPVA